MQSSTGRHNEGVVIDKYSFFRLVKCFSTSNMFIKYCAGISFYFQKLNPTERIWKYIDVTIEMSITLYNYHIYIELVDPRGNVYTRMYTAMDRWLLAWADHYNNNEKKIDRPSGYATTTMMMTIRCTHVYTRTYYM